VKMFIYIFNSTILNQDKNERFSIKLNGGIGELSKRKACRNCHSR